uniref:PARP-type domain-containing protein n=1 Tax=Sus scrofa TaxID=9823 RepID=A0A8D1KNU5_PIG
MVELSDEVHYTKSGHASCKKCKKSITKNSLWMAIMVQVQWGLGLGEAGLHLSFVAWRRGQGSKTRQLLEE